MLMEAIQMSDSFKVKSKVVGSYNVDFIDNIHDSIEKRLKISNHIFVIDDKIKNLYQEEIKNILKTETYIIITAKEENKTLEYSKEIIKKLISKGIRKNDVLVAIGGGITQDLVAFVSSILFRGLDWLFYPTTLLAQCDSCIGSKSSINLDNYKNLLGTFLPPKRIFIYHGFLKTLKDEEIRSGIGEMLHYFLTEKSDLAERINKNYEDLLIDRSLLNFFIKKSLKIKKKIIEIDEFDENIRHIFNYGHTFGHAIESITEYKIPHGQAVSIGIDLANYISVKKAFITEEEFQILHNYLIKNIPTFIIDKKNIKIFFKALSKDKKNKNNLLGCILPKEIGRVEKVFIKMDDELKNIILDYFVKYG